MSTVEWDQAVHPATFEPVIRFRRNGRELFTLTLEFMQDFIAYAGPVCNDFEMFWFLSETQGLGIEEATLAVNAWKAYQDKHPFNT